MSNPKAPPEAFNWLVVLQFQHSLKCLPKRGANVGIGPPVRTSPSSRRTLGVAVPTGPPLVRREPQCLNFRLSHSSSPASASCLYLIGLRRADFSLQSLCRESLAIGTVILP